MSDAREGRIAHIARVSADWSATTAAFAASLVWTLVWAVTWPLFESLDTWQLVLNTATSIVTFVMVFLIQRAQKKDSQAIHLKLNELVAAVQGASNRLISAENLTEDELRTLDRHYRKLIQLAEQDEDVTGSHSVEDAKERHEEPPPPGKPTKGRRRKGRTA